MKAFIFDPLWDKLITPQLQEQLEKSGLELIITKNIAPLTACKALYKGEDDRILCINPDYIGWKLTSDDYNTIPNLKAIVSAATAFSWIDMTYANSNNIPICNIRNFSTQAVAEWAITMMFAVARRVPCLIKEGFPLDFDKDFMKFRGIELRGKTAGVIGLGNIGNAIAQRLEGLGMQVIYFSKSPKETTYTRYELADLFKKADVIFPTLALNEATKKLITPELLQTMKPSSIFISVVHDLFNEKIILEMVKNNKLFGFGFESPPSTFTNYEGNVWAAPAYAWATKESMLNAMTKWISNMIKASKNSFPTRVNNS